MTLASKSEGECTMTITLLLLSSTLSCLSFVLAWTYFLKTSFALLRETDAWGDLAPAFPDLSNSCALAGSSCYSLRSSSCLKPAASFISSHPGGTSSQSRWGDDSVSCFRAFTPIPPWSFPVPFPQRGVEKPRWRPQEVGWGGWSGPISWPLLGGSTQGHRTAGKHKRLPTKPNQTCISIADAVAVLALYALPYTDL